MQFIHKIHYVPTNNPVLSAFLAGKLAALRLQALTVSPTSFGGEFVLQIFSEMPHGTWIQRLERSKVHTFVAIAYPEGTTEEDQRVDTGNIVGTSVLIGPISNAAYTMTSLKGANNLEDNEESKWHCTALYCSPEVRGKGVGRMLVNARISFAKTQSISENVKIRVLVHPHNVKVLGPLESRGFVNVGKCTPVEAISAAWDAMLLPPGRGAMNPELNHGQTIFVMELCERASDP